MKGHFVIRGPNDLKDVYVCLMKQYDHNIGACFKGDVGMMLAQRVRDTNTRLNETMINEAKQRVINRDNQVIQSVLKKRLYTTSASADISDYSQASNDASMMSTSSKRHKSNQM